MALVLQLLLPADARYLPKTRRAIEGYLEETAALPEQLDDVILALDEACANVIRHAFPEGKRGTLRLRAEIEDDGITVQVEDDGVGFDPFHLDLSGRFEEASGRGLEIIRRLVNQLDVESPTPTGGTRLRMQKSLGQ
jgi:serine/threonine-protein kinase RsbW